MFEANGRNWVKIEDLNESFLRDKKLHENIGDINSRIEYRSSEAIYLRKRLASLKRLYKAFGSITCQGQIDMVQKNVLTGVTWLEATRSVENAYELFKREFKERNMLVMESLESELYSKKYPFGQSFHDKFPSARKDVLEASKSLALERHNACVFHSLRTMERILKATCTMVGATYSVDQSSWGPIIGKIESRIPASRLTPKDYFAKEIVGFVHSIKDVRDSRAMHIQKELPSVTDTKGIFDRVSAAAKRAAEHLDESGTFT